MAVMASDQLDVDIGRIDLGERQGDLTGGLAAAYRFRVTFGETLAVGDWPVDRPEVMAARRADWCRKRDEGLARDVAAGRLVQTGPNCWTHVDEPRMRAIVRRTAERRPARGGTTRARAAGHRRVVSTTSSSSSDDPGPEPPDPPALPEVDRVERVEAALADLTASCGRANVLLAKGDHDLEVRMDDLQAQIDLVADLVDETTAGVSS